MRLVSWFLLALLLPWQATALRAECAVPEQVSAVRAAAEHELSVASQNLWRFSPREMSASQRPQRIAAWSRHLREVLRYPHILVVQEVASLALLEELAERVSADGGPRYQPLLVRGNDHSGIDVAVLLREPVVVAKVTPLFARQRNGQHWLFSRPPLHLEISEPFAFDLVALHLRSGHGLHDVRRGDWVKSKRAAQAKMIRGWAQEKIAAGKALMLIGDLNSAPGDDDYAQPLNILQQAPLWSVWQALPEVDRFSYIYRCQRQAVDHILLSAKLRQRMQRAAVSRGNAGRYRKLYGGQGSTEVVSDHDALVVYLRR